MSVDTITAEEFAGWREDPVTRWVLTACMKAAQAQREAWVEATWRPDSDPDFLLLKELYTRADAYRALAETDYDGWLAAHEESE